MSDFLKSMAAASARRAAMLGQFSAADFDRPLIRLEHRAFGVIAEIKDRSPAEGDLAVPDEAYEALLAVRPTG